MHHNEKSDNQESRYGVEIHDTNYSEISKTTKRNKYKRTCDLLRLAFLAGA
jgi:hypothetical protein